MGDQDALGNTGGGQDRPDRTCPRDPACARIAACRYRLPRPGPRCPLSGVVPGLRVHDSYDALLANPEVEAVYIPLSNHPHVEYALKAQEIDQLIEARDQTGKLIAEAFMIAHHPQWARATALIDAGAIGKLEHVEGCFTYFNRDLTNIRHDPTMGGGGKPAAASASRCVCSSAWLIARCAQRFSGSTAQPLSGQWRSAIATRTKRVSRGIERWSIAQTVAVQLMLHRLSGSWKTPERCMQRRSI